MSNNSPEVDGEVDGKADVDIRNLMSRLFGSDSSDAFWIEPTLPSIFTNSRLDALRREFESLTEFQLAKALLALSQLSQRRISEVGNFINRVFKSGCAIY